MNECLELINNLNRGEKKSISQFLNNEKKKQLSDVFQIVIAGGGITDVSVSLGKTKQQSSLLLHQLKEKILNRLTHTRKLNPIEVELRNAINEIEFLKDRFLYRQAIKRIKVLKPRLLEHERFTYLQEVLLIEVEISSFLLSEQEFKKRLDSIMFEYHDYLKKNEIFYRYKVQFYRNLAGVYDDSNQQPTGESYEMNPRDNRSGYYFYLRSALIQNLATHRYSQAQATAVQLVDLMENTPHEFDKIPFQRMDVYFMSALSLIITGNIASFEKLKQKVLNTPISNDKLGVKLHERVIYLDSVAYSTGRIVPESISTFVTNFQAVRKNISIEYDLRIIEQISNFFVMINDFKKAKKWNNEILNKPSKEQRKQFSARARIRAIYLEIQGGDTDFLITLIDRVLSIQNIEEVYKSEIIESLKTIKEGKTKNISKLLDYFHFLNQRKLLTSPKKHKGFVAYDNEFT